MSRTCQTSMVMAGLAGMRHKAGRMAASMISTAYLSIEA